MNLFSEMILVPTFTVLTFKSKRGKRLFRTTVQYKPNIENHLIVVFQTGAKVNTNPCLNMRGKETRAMIGVEGSHAEK